MTLSQRLPLAIAGPEAVPATGAVLCVGPAAGLDLSPLDRARTVIVQGFRPDHDAWLHAGWRTVATLEAASEDAGGQFGAALVCLPRARAAGQGLIAEVSALMPVGAPIWIDGQKTDGVDTMIRALRARTAISQPIAKAHGKILCLTNPGPAPFDDWRPSELSPAPGFVTLPGVFSAEKIDRGSSVLAAALPGRLPGRVADLGAGWGWLAAQILTREAVAELHLIEADHTALGCARRNIADPRARFHWADATAFQPDGRFDHIVTNPPFHAGRAAEPRIGQAFIAAAARMLTPSGVLHLVANRHLPYEQTLTTLFRDVAEEAGDAGFKVLRAARPVQGARPRG